MGKRLTTEEVIQRFKAVHGDRYDYSETKFANAPTKVRVICRVHGAFEIRYDHHITGQGCTCCNLVRGVGISEVGKYARTYIDEHGVKRSTKEYDLWNGILERCYSEKFQEKWHTYKGCTMSKNFLNFQWFAEWCNNQIGFKEGWHIDKDLLFKGNKHYSEYHCVFLPPNLNMFLVKSDKIRGAYPVGVSYHKRDKMFAVRCGNNDGTRADLGRFATVEEAFVVYKNYKESIAKKIAIQYKDEIDSRAYEALLKYEVKIDD